MSRWAEKSFQPGLLPIKLACPRGSRVNIESHLEIQTLQRIVVQRFAVHTERLVLLQRQVFQTVFDGDICPLMQYKMVKLPNVEVTAESRSELSL
jgi:hypothetical protein